MDLSPNQRKWLHRTLITAAVLVGIVGADYMKSTTLCCIKAGKSGATAAYVRSVSFDGLWRVTLDTRISGTNGIISYSVTPILPIVSN